MPAYAAPLTDISTRVAFLRRLAWFLDAQFSLPGTRFRFGVDAIAGLVPGAGDLLMALPSLYIIWEARRLGAPNALIGRMAVNVLIELGAGWVPLVGDVFDAVFKANIRNVMLLEDWARGRA